MKFESNIEPTLTVPPALQPVLRELSELEALFHAACPAATPELFEKLVAPEFWEIGATGRRYSRALALSVLTNRPATPPDQAWQTRDFHVSELGADIYLLTYTLVQPDRSTLRSTLWRRAAAGWQAVFHQGTIVMGAA